MGSEAPGGKVNEGTKCEGEHGDGVEQEAAGESRTTRLG